jgi:alpha-amylase
VLYSCVFWGDLYGCSGTNAQAPVAQLSDLIRCRKLFAFGVTGEYWDHGNCVGWTRSGDEDHDGCAVVMCNSMSPG